MSQRFELIHPATINDLDDFSAQHRANSADLARWRHACIEGHQFIARWSKLPKETTSVFVIAETSFGRGLNFLGLCALWEEYAPRLAKLYVISSEQTPVTRDDLAQCLNLSPDLQCWANRLLESYPVLTPGFHGLEFDEGRINLLLMLGEPTTSYQELLQCGDVLIETTLRDYYVDAWCLHGDSNTVCFTDELFVTMGLLSKETTTITSFLNSEAMKQGLVLAGFQEDIVRTTDQALGMFRARYQGPPTKRIKRHTPWHRSLSISNPPKRAIVLGAGLAGCFTAEALVRRGWAVTLLDANSQVGGGASGNPRAILYPKLSSYDSPLNGLMLTAYLYAIRVYEALLHQFPVGQLTGILQMAYNDKERASQNKLKAWLARYPDLGVFVEAEQASMMAGIALQTGGILIPSSGWIDSKALCERLIQTKEITWVGNTRIESLNYDQGEWHAGKHHAEVLVLANGYQAATFSQTHHLPLQMIRGQMTCMLSNEASDKLKIPLCAKGHILPSQEGVHYLGATYQAGIGEAACSVKDDADNVANLHSFPTDLGWSKKVSGHWAGVRTATPDYLPLVGPVAHAELFQQRFSGLATNSKRWIPFPGVYHEGLYVCTGFGSRGLTTIPLSAEWLASLMTKEPGRLSRTMAQSISPARFLRRELFRKLDQ